MRSSISSLNLYMNSAATKILYITAHQSCTPYLRQEHSGGSDNGPHDLSFQSANSDAPHPVTKFGGESIRILEDYALPESLISWMQIGYKIIRHWKDHILQNNYEYMVQ